MNRMGSQITGVSVVYSTVRSGADQRKTSKLRITGLCEGNPPVTGIFPSQRARNAENISIWWRHPDDYAIHSLIPNPSCYKAPGDETDPDVCPATVVILRSKTIIILQTINFGPNRTIWVTWPIGLLNGFPDTSWRMNTNQNLHQNNENTSLKIPTSFTDDDGTVSQINVVLL